MYKFGLAQQGTPIRAVTIVSPPAPIVTVTGATYTGATLSWSGSTGKYTIVGSTGNTYSGGLTLATNVTKTVASVKLPQGGTYTAKVIASAGGTYSTLSAAVTIVIPYKPPTAPVIKSKTIGYNGVTLTWSASVSNTPLVYRIRKDGDTVKQNISALTEFVPLNAGATYGLTVRADISGTEIASDLSTPSTVYIPFPAKPSVPVVTQSGATYSGVKLTWTAQTVVQAIKNSVTYDIIGGTDGVTYASGLTGLSSSVRIPAGTDNIEVVARAGLTFTESAPITVTIPLQKPTAPVLSQPVVGSTGTQLSWNAATGNSPITYTVVSALGGATYSTGLTGTSTVIPNSKFTSYGSYLIQVVATAGTTYSVSAGVTLRFTPPPPDDIVVNYLSTQGCQLSWASDPFSNNVSYSISELAGATFSVVQGPTFNTQSGLWLAGVSFGSAQVYDFFVSGVTAGVTGTASEIVVYVPPATSYVQYATDPVTYFYNRGTYTITIPPRYSGFQAQLVGGGGGGGNYDGDGGAGGFCLGTISAQAGTTFALVVGGGGKGGLWDGGDSEEYNGKAGGKSSISTLLAAGGSGMGGLGQQDGGRDGGGGEGSGGSVNIRGEPGLGYRILGRSYGGGGQGAPLTPYPHDPDIFYGADGEPGNDGCALITFFP